MVELVEMEWLGSSKTDWKDIKTVVGEVRTRIVVGLEVQTVVN